MSIVIDQEPQDFVPDGNPNVFLLDSTNKAAESMRYVLDIYPSGNASLAVRSKVPPRPSDGRGLLDVSPIVRNYSSYKLGTPGEAADFYEAEDTRFYYDAAIGEEVAGVVTILTGVSGKASWNARLLRGDFIDFDSDDFDLASGNDPHHKFTDAPRFRVNSGDNLWIYGYTSDNSNTLPFYARLGYTGQGAFPDDFVNTSDAYFFRFACGPANLSGTLPANYIGEYTIQFFDFANQAISEIYTFVVEDTPCDITPTRLHFLNKYGGFDGFNFNGKYREFNSYRREEYTRRQGSTTGDSWSYSLSERGRSNHFTEEVKRYTAGSQWIAEDEASWLTDLFSSTEVYWEVDDELLPVIITSNDYEVKRTETTKLIRFDIEFELAHKEVRYG